MKRALNQLSNNGVEFANEEDRQIFRMAMRRLIAPCTFYRNGDSELENQKNAEMAWAIKYPNSEADLQETVEIELMSTEFYLHNSTCKLFVEEASPY